MSEVKQEVEGLRKISCYSSVPKGSESSKKGLRGDDLPIGWRWYGPDAIYFKDDSAYCIAKIQSLRVHTHGTVKVVVFWSISPRRSKSFNGGDTYLVRIAGDLDSVKSDCLASQAQRIEKRLVEHRSGESRWIVRPKGWVKTLQKSELVVLIEKNSGDEIRIKWFVNTLARGEPIRRGQLVKRVDSNASPTIRRMELNKAITQAREEAEKEAKHLELG